MEYNRDVFIRNIEMLMKLRGIEDQTEFNSMIGSRDALTKWKGSTAPAFKSILKICGVFECDINWLITGQDPPKATGSLTPQTIDKYPWLPQTLNDINQAVAENSPCLITAALKYALERLEIYKKTKTGTCQ